MYESLKRWLRCRSRCPSRSRYAREAYVVQAPSQNGDARGAVSHRARMRRLIFSLIRSSSKVANVPNRRAPHGLRRSQRDRSKVAAESRPLQMAFVCEQSGSVTIPNARRVSGSLRIRDQNSAVPPTIFPSSTGTVKSVTIDHTASSPFTTRRKTSTLAWRRCARSRFWWRPKPAIRLSRKDWHSPANRAVV
jgi:hypothetical protein